MASLSVEEQILELQTVRKLLQQERRSIQGTIVRLRNECKELRDQKRALMTYIKELEKFQVDRADIEKLKDIFLRS